MVPCILVGKQGRLSKAGEDLDAGIVSVYESGACENAAYIFISPAYNGSGDWKCDISALLSRGRLE